MTLRTLLRFLVGPVMLLATASDLRAQQITDDIILKAMNDELARSMKELALPNYEKPFFIMYTAVDQNTLSVSATLGSLLQSSAAHQRLKTNTRILVGDYSFNDESLEDNLFSSPTAREINLPLDDDYAGIRRAYWSTTDKVYRDAARHFDKHKETLKETGKPLADIPHRSFAKSAAVKMISTRPSTAVDKSAWEEKVKKLSAIFLQHPAIAHSAVVFQFAEGHQYLCNSEGTVAKIPFGQATITAVCQSKNGEGEFSVQQIFHVAASPDDLPSEKDLVAEVENVVKGIDGKLSSPKMEEEYSGPVLLMGPAVSQLISGVFLEGRENIYANDNITKLTGYRFDVDGTSLEGKIGKSVCNESITVNVRPRMKAFKGTPLLGAFDLDHEGVAPPDELVVIEGGILKNLLNNRTLTSSTQVANGFSDGPGVVEMTVARKDTEKALKDKLIAKAKEEGLDFAIIVRDAPAFGLMSVYKVSLTDGKEELMRNTILKQANLKTLKRISGASEAYKAYNLRGGPTTSGITGIGMVSFIVPEAILVDELDIMPLRLPSLKEEDYVLRP